jgi:DNA-binding NtrC family response regulator
MTQYHWPGNVRELRNVVERAMILSEHNLIDQEQLPFELRSNEKQEWGTQNPNPVEFTEDMSLDAVEKIHISRVLKKLDWNKSRTAKVLGVSRATLREKIRRYSLSES